MSAEPETPVGPALHHAAFKMFLKLEFLPLAQTLARSNSPEIAAAIARGVIWDNWRNLNDADYAHFVELARG